MANNWQSFEIKSITAPTKAIKDWVNGIDRIITVIDRFNSIVNDIINVLNAIKIPAVPDPQVAIINSLLSQAQQYVKDFQNIGAYMLPVFPEDIKNINFSSVDNFLNTSKKTLTGMEGGSLTFRDKVVNSFYDEADTHRPNFDDRSIVGGWVYAVDSGEISSFISAFSRLSKFFNFLNGIPLPIADVVGLNAKTFKKSLVLQWSLGLGLEPTSFVIYSKPITDSEFEKIAEIQYDTMKTQYINNVENSLSIKGVNINNNIAYLSKLVPNSYRITIEPQKSCMYEYRVATIYNGNESKNYASVQVAVKQVEITTKANQNSCANLVCTETNEDLVVSCGKDQATATNFNLNTCLAGTTKCEMLTNANCKFNVNDKCTSVINIEEFGYGVPMSGVTTVKTIYKDENGNIIPIPNTCFYNPILCQRGNTAQVCDGYIKEAKPASYPPDWSNFTINSIPYLGGLTESVVKMLESFKTKTVKENDVQVKFTNTLADTADFFKQQLNELKAIIRQLEELSSISVPNGYSLIIPPQRGGIKYFLDQFENATNGPNSGVTGYTMGMVLLVGGPEYLDVFKSFKFIQALFGK
jgi:hypothetical protein